MSGRTEGGAKDHYRSPFILVRREAGEDAGFVTYSDHGHSSGNVQATAHLRLPFIQIGAELGIDIGHAHTRGGVGHTVL